MSSLISKDELTRIKGIYQAKYGYEMDEWTAVILTELNEKFSIFNQRVQNSTTEIGKATQAIKGQIQPIHFSNHKQAFLFGIGKFLIPSLVVLVGIFTAAYFVGQSEKYTVISQFVDSYPNFDAFREMIRTAEILEVKSKKYLVLRPAANIKSMEVGREYQYLKEQNIVVVPLGADNQ